MHRNVGHPHLPVGEGRGDATRRASAAQNDAPLVAGLSAGVPQTASGPHDRAALALHDSKSLMEAIPAVLQAAGETGRWEAVALYGMTPLAPVLRCIDIWCSEPQRAPTLLQTAPRSLVEPSRGPVGEAWTRGETVWLEDLSPGHDPLIAAAVRDGFEAGAAVPLFAAGDPAGLLLVLTREQRDRDDATLRAAASIAGAVAVTIDRHRLEQERAFDRALLASQNEAAIDATYVVAPGGVIMSWNRRFAELWDLADELTAGPSDEVVTAAMLRKVLDPEAFLTGRATAHADPEAPGRDEIILTDGTILDRWSAPLRHVEAGVTYGRAWFFRDVTRERRSERHATFLADATALLSASFAYEENVEELARLAVPTIADWCILDVVDDDRRVRRMAVAGTDPDMIQIAHELAPHIRETPGPDTRGVQRVIRTGKAELASEIDDAWLTAAARGDTGLLERLRALGLRSYLCVPLSARGHLLGVMTLVTAGSGRRYDDDELTFARTLAGRAALLLDNLRLYSDRDRIARTLQESLLPAEMPSIAGIDVAAYYRAAGEAYDVGGDFYDVFSMGRRAWGVVIGDVCGKGPDAAAITALARNTVRVAAMQARKPKKILGLLNQAIFRQFDGTRFCTVTFARLQPGPEGVDALICRGGHPPSLIRRADGTITSLRGPGELIGAFGEVGLADLPLHLAPDEMLLLYTDGIIEARRGEETFGEARLEDALARCSGEDAAGCVARIIAAVEAFSDGPLRDDIALLALRADAATLPKPPSRERTGPLPLA